MLYQYSFMNDLLFRRIGIHSFNNHMNMTIQINDEVKQVLLNLSTTMQFAAERLENRLRKGEYEGRGMLI